MTKTIRNYKENIGTSANPHYMDHEFYIEDGVVRWASNDRVPFEDMLRKIAMEFIEVTEEVIAASIEARDADTAASLAAYRKQMEDHTPSDEEMFEMRAAFGEGAKVVNVLTGQSIQL